MKSFKDLSDEIQFLFICNQIEQGNKPNENLSINKGKLDGNFNWKITPQGFGFWDSVTFGEIYVLPKND